MQKQKIVSYLLVLLVLMTTHVQADTPAQGFSETKDGVIIYPNPNFSGNTKSVRLQVITDNIIRITASPTTDLPEVKSLITVYSAISKNYTVSKTGDNIFV